MHTRQQKRYLHRPTLCHGRVQDQKLRGVADELDNLNKNNLKVRRCPQPCYPLRLTLQVGMGSTSTLWTGPWSRCK